jgi:hypothetical protein
MLSSPPIFQVWGRRPLVISVSEADGLGEHVLLATVVVLPKPAAQAREVLPTLWHRRNGPS